MRLSDCGAEAVKIILAELHSGSRVIPAEFPVASLAKAIGSTPTNVGSAFTPYIDKPLMTQGYFAVKCGTPRRIIVTHSPH